MNGPLWTVTTNLLLLASIQMVACTDSTAPRNFFRDIDGNLTRIRWAHAVNARAKLDEALKDGNVAMLEGDVSLGNVTGTNAADAVPIMAHPPAVTSDLSLEDFLKTVVESKTGKGIKLDFKSIEAFEASRPILENKKNLLAFPVFLNADILPGPVNATTVPVDAKSFLSGAKAFPNYTLSVGWTTRYGVEANVTEGRYTAEQIDKMIDTLAEQNLTQPITYPVRAGPAANDIEAIESLTKRSPAVNDATLTVWSAEGDKVDAERLSALVERVGVDKVYLDVPDDLAKRLRFSGASGIDVASTTIATTIAATIAALLATMPFGV
ncbi:protein FAM151B isoform X2 [Ptiloglossa arizonensis]|uniref:protein FAM151B isoform X2 n=1 Tax=Ptiloglossa arizonensis TaxID=3350558 RepID=UPI003F9EF0A2